MKMLQRFEWKIPCSPRSLMLLLWVMTLTRSLSGDIVTSAAESAVATLDNADDRSHRHQKQVVGGSDQGSGGGVGGGLDGRRQDGGADRESHRKENIDEDEDADEQSVRSVRPASERSERLGDNVHVVEDDTPLVGRVVVRQCEAMKVDICQGLGYNVTGWPNLVGHESLSDAEQQLRTFTPLIQYECSSNGELKLFLCAAYIPMCTEQVPDVIGPCRSVCERVRRQCEPVLQKFGFPWPSLLNCDRFHARNNVDGRMCMEGPGGEQTEPVSRSTTPQIRLIGPGPEQPDDRVASSDCGGSGSPASGCVKCINASRKLDGRSASTLMDQSTAEMIRIWTLVWSSMSVLSTLFAIVTFAVNARKYTYSERLVLMTAICSAVCAIGQLSRSMVVGSSSSLSSAVGMTTSLPCRNPSVKAGLPSQFAEPSSECKVMFVVVYYFSAATFLWWLVLVVVWTLHACCRRWTDAEARRRLSAWFHFVCWSMPAVATVILLVRKQDIEVDQAMSESSVRLCHVAMTNGSGLGFVLVPLSVCLAIGIVLLVFGMAGYQRRRRSLRHTNNCCAKADDDASKALKHSEQLQHQLRPQTAKTVAETAVSGLVSGPLQPSGKAASSTVAADSDENSAAVRIGVFIIIGLVALLCAVSTLAYEYASHLSSNMQQSAASTLIKVLSSVLLALSIGPWLVFTGHAAESWNSFVSRRCQSRKTSCQLSSKKQKKQQQPAPRSNFLRNDYVGQPGSVPGGFELDDSGRCLHCGGCRENGGGGVGGNACSDVQSFGSQQHAPIVSAYQPFDAAEDDEDDDYMRHHCHSWNAQNIVIDPNAFGRGSRPATVRMAAGNECCAAAPTADAHRLLELQRQQQRQHTSSKPGQQGMMISCETRHSTSASAASRHLQQQQQQKITGNGSSRGGLVSCKFCRRQHFVENFLVI